MTNDQVYERAARVVREEMAKWTTPITLNEMIKLIADRYHVNADRLSQEFEPKPSRAEVMRILQSAIQHLTAPIEDMTARHLLWRAYYDLLDSQQIAVRSYHRSR